MDNDFEVAILKSLPSDETLLYEVVLQLNKDYRLVGINDQFDSSNPVSLLNSLSNSISNANAATKLNVLQPRNKNNRKK